MLGRRESGHTPRRDGDPFPGRGMVVSLLLMFLIDGFSCSPNFPFKFPGLISAWEGSCALLKCDFSTRHSSEMKNLTWYKDAVYDEGAWKGTVVYYHSVKNQTRGPTFLDRSMFLGNLVKDCTLLIQELRVNDSGQYGVRLEGDTVKWMSKPFLSLNITDSPPKPQIVLPSELKESQYTKVTCSIDYYCEEYPIQLHWEGPVEGRNKTESWASTMGLKTTNTLTFTPSWQDNMKNLTCRLTSEKKAGKSSEREITLDVKHSPKNVHIVLEGSPQTILEGDSLTLWCFYNSSNPPVSKYDWYKNAMLVGPNTQNLTLNPAAAEDAGKYSCKATNSIGSNNAQPLEIVIHFAPKKAKVEKVNKGITKEGQRVTLTCSAQCYPPVTAYQWYKDDHLLKQSEKNLIFSKILAGDSGKYHCEVYSPMGNASSPPEDLNVLYAPKNVSVVVLHSDLRWIKEGDKVTLLCYYNSSNPEVSQFTWYLSDKRQPLIRQNETTFQRITANDSGQYYCEAENAAGGSRSLEVSLDVKYAPKDVKLQLSPQRELKEGDSADLKCTAEKSHPGADIFRWYKDGKTWDRNGSFIQFQRLESSDSGGYKCEAVNNISATKSQTVQLYVQYAPRNVKVLVPSLDRIIENLEVMLTCDSDAKPEANDFKWYAANQLLNDHGKWLTIRKIKRSQAGLYHCEAKNKIASRKSEQIMINVRYSSKTIGKFSAIAVGLFIFLIIVVLLVLRLTACKKLSRPKLPGRGENDDRSDTFFVLNKKKSRDDPGDALGNLNMSSQPEGEESLSYASLRFSFHAEEGAATTRATVNNRSSLILQSQDASAIYSVPRKLRKPPQMPDPSTEYENIPTPTIAKTDDKKEEEINYSTIINLKCRPAKQLEWESESDSEEGVVQYAALRH